MNIIPRTVTALLGSSALLALTTGIAVGAQGGTYVPVRAVLRAEPSADAMQNVHLPVEGGTLGLFLDASIGDIVQYRIDLNTAWDSDGDGITDNDVDNSYHSSFRSGGTFPVSMRPAPGETERELLLFAADALGNTSTARLTILFDGQILPETVLEVGLREEKVRQEEPAEDTPEEMTPEPPEQLQEIRIVADREVLFTGEEFTLSVQGAPAGTIVYLWDLQRDGKTDTQSDIPSVLLAPDAPGVLPVRVKFVDIEGRSLGTVSAEFTVEPTGGMPSDMPLRIDVTVQGLLVHLRPKLESPLNLAELEPTWVFGDGERSYLLEPQHTYKRSGTYDITLALHELKTQKVVAQAQTNITVSGGAEVSRKGGGFFSPFVFMFKIVLIVLLLLSFIAGAVFLFLLLKAKRENVPVREIFLQYKKQIFGEEVEIAPLVAEPAAPEVLDEEEKKEEPAPMKLEKEKEESKEEIETVPEEPSPAKEPAPQLLPKEPQTPEPSAPATSEEEVMPSWLSGAPSEDTQAPSEPPVSPPSAPSTPKGTPPPPPAEVAAAPSWLSQGLEGAEEKEKQKVEEGVVTAQEGETSPEVHTPLTQEPGTAAKQDDSGTRQDNSGTQQDGSGMQPPKKARSPEEQEHLREKRRRYRKNKRERERKAREVTNDELSSSSEVVEEKIEEKLDEPIAFIKAEDIPKQEEDTSTSESSEEKETSEDQDEEPKKAA